ncbi:hypothetical protein PVAND_006435 [Polypedilum vanderplanki]|uniref:Uncharacterized protein n=1 Tax=Polypedilum vanderplanki TaxID=319348 RepID=A0A9J6C3M1_POLVA|nr:hypothetical protein PVAND_006435 [Polypedilum vanderplanki]
MNEYNTEKYIEQYEHISKLELLSNTELNQVKKKRAQFEVSIKNPSDPKPFIEYIKFELALTKKFQQLEYRNENDERAIERALSRNIKDIFNLALRKFQDRRELWSLYISFAKSKFSNIVSGIYQQMLNFHNTKEDYIEAIEYEMSKSNFTVALGLIIQAMAKEKDSKELVALHIRCSLQQAHEHEDETYKENTIKQVTTFYTRFLKESSDVMTHINLLQNIEHITFALNFQNEVLSNLIKKFSHRAETWDLLAKRHLNGLFYGDKDKIDSTEEIPFLTKLKHALAIYNKSFEIISPSNVKQMHELYITALLKLDEEQTDNLTEFDLHHLRSALGEAFLNGYNDDKLTEIHFIYFLKLRIFNKFDQKEIEEMCNKGIQLYPKCLELYELAIKYFIEIKNYDKIPEIFNHVASTNDEEMTIALYKFLREILSNTKEKTKILISIMEAIDCNNCNYSVKFYPYIIEYYEQSHGIEKAREFFESLLKSKNAAFLPLTVFKMMINLEQQQKTPNNKIISNCFERGIDAFGKDDSDIWIQYVQHLWKQNKFTEADGIRKRAIEKLKKDVKKVNEFELKLTLLRNKSGETDDD